MTVLIASFVMLAVSVGMLVAVMSTPPRKRPPDPPERDHGDDDRLAG